MEKNKIKEKLKRYSIGFLCIFAVFCVMAGCSNNEKKEKVETVEEMPISINYEYIGMETIRQNMYAYVYRDTVTDVMYQFTVFYNDSGGLTTMLNPEDGTPLLYSEYKEMLKNVR